MSGGIDSAVVAAIAADAIGGEGVHLVSMPTKYNSDATKGDARLAAEMLGSPFTEMPIGEAIIGIEKMFSRFFDIHASGVGNENMQARVRGMTLMRLSNDFKWMLLSTGNKSEMAVGYATLYGDMSGGFNPLKDVYKTKVFELAAWRNQNIIPIGSSPNDLVMPDSIITRPASAELAEGQQDTDSLPPYDVLDPILRCYIEGNMGIKQILAHTGSPIETIEKVVKLVDIAEFKRRQACPGIKITERNFGKGRRYPIARTGTVPMVGQYLNWQPQ